jgi:tetratricopeptide (TPR) repeat protein
MMLADYGDVLVRAGRPTEELEQFQRAVTIEPLFSKGHRLIGNVTIITGQLSRAIASYRKSLDIEPGQWWVAERIGSIYLLLGDDQQAEHWYELALAQAPLGQEQMGMHMGRLHLYRGNREQAREHFISALAANPNNQVILYYLVNFDLADGDFPGALARIGNAFPGLLNDEPVLDAVNHVAAIQLAAVLSATGEQERMEKLLDLAWQDAESYDPRHYEDEAAIHALRGDRAKALEALGRVTGSAFLFWNDFVKSHPAFTALIDDPDFIAINEKMEAEMARQLASVRELEANGELAPFPKR